MAELDGLEVVRVIKQLLGHARLKDLPLLMRTVAGRAKALLFPRKQPWYIDGSRNDKRRKRGLELLCAAFHWIGRLAR